MKLEATNLVVTRQGGRRVLDGATVSILPGRVTGIVGPNGAGKSTLLGALAGLLPTTSGRVELDGRDVATLAPAERARAIAFLPQDRTVHWPMSARSIVALGRLPHRAAARGATGETEAAAVSHALAVMDLAALADRPVDRLSGGELARVLVARALAQESAILLADEPTAGLDPVHALVLLEHFRRLATGGRAIAIVLHDMTLAARFCDDVVLIDAGRIAAAGPAAEVLTPARLEPVLGVGIATGTVGGVPVVVATAPRT